MLMTTVITITYSQDEKLVFRTYAGKKQSSQSSPHNFQNPVLDDDAEEAEADQDDQRDEKNTVTGSKVVFGLWEETQSDMTVTITSD